MPAHGGNFVRFLLSLSDNTWPCYPKGYKGNEPRHKVYSFKNLYWKYTSWCNFHETFEAVDQWDTGPFLDQNMYDTYNLCLHPGEDFNHVFIDTFFERNAEHLPRFDKINYLQIKLSPKYEDYIETFKQENMRHWHEMNDRPQFLPPWLPVRGTKQFDEITVAYSKFEKEFNPYTINLDQFLLGLDSFTEEYTKMIDHVNLPRMIPEAQDMYKGWASSRKLFKHIPEFKE
jgi:hypothetical protein